jgi:hypothetical protein
MKSVLEKIRREFIPVKNYVVFDRWLIDTIMNAQGNKQLLKCTEESCLFAIGHLLSVDLVLSGFITKQNGKYCINADLVDIKNNIASGYMQRFVFDFYDTTLISVSRELVKQLLDERKTKRDISSNAPSAKENEHKPTIPSTDNVDTRVVKVSRNNMIPEHGKKATLNKRLFWVPVAAVVVGAAVAGAYYYMSKAPTTSTIEPVDNDISLDDAPKHPEGWNNILATFK